MKGRNGKPIIRWSFSPSLQISDWKLRLPDWQDFWDSRCPLCQDTQAAVGQGEGDTERGDHGILQLHLCCLGLATTACHSWPGPPAAATSAAPTPSASSAAQGSPSSCSEPSSLLGPSPSITAHPTRAILQTDLPLPARAAAPQLFPSLSNSTILVNQRCSLLPWFDSKFSHFLFVRVRVTHTQPTPRGSCMAADWGGKEHVPAFLKREQTASDPGNTRITFVPKAAREVGFISHSPASFLPQSQFNFD